MSLLAIYLVNSICVGKRQRITVLEDERKSEFAQYKNNNLMNSTVMCNLAPLEHSSLTNLKERSVSG